jgi:subtilase family serine protease
LNPHIMNDGQSESPGFTVNWYPNTNSSTVGYTKTYSSLAPWASSPINSEYEYDRSGTKNWKAVVDTEDSVQETDEGNNTKTGSVMVPKRLKSG